MTCTAHTRQKMRLPAALMTGSLVGLLLLLVGCSADTPSSGRDAPSPVPTESSTQSELNTGNADHPDVLEASLEHDNDGSWSLEVTLSSQYDSPERYADGWRVLDKDGTVLGEHTLTHDHADEQPVTRKQFGLQIPESVGQITIQGSDTDNGYGGETLVVEVPR